MLITLFVLLVCILILAGVLLVWSPGKPKPYLNENGKVLAGSISEKIHVSINGVEQGMFIKSKNEANPVLLFIHGGPGMPEYFLAQSYPIGLEDYFTVCYWEQRGAGLSYSSDIPSETLTEEQLISDTREVTNYLRQRFGQEKIYLMAHSWGSFIGIQAAAQAPEMYRAYIGIAQTSRPLESEKLAYKYMMEQYMTAGDKRMVQKLEEFPITEMDFVPNSYRSLRDEAMHKLGIGTTHNMKSVVSGIFLPSWKCPEYTLSEKVNIWRGKWSAHSTNMWNQMIAADLTAKVQKLDIPVYFFHGIYDYTCSYALAKDYFERLQAPSKGFYTFEQSAHSPLFEEPEKMQHILQKDVLVGMNNLADAK
ncbi:MAG TPA: alpha/beta hydrolase [Syntrophomonadaceae bacterium]|nr:alpha/beta hydrolase [Syntrophomonadaceae bacterium]